LEIISYIKDLLMHYNTVVIPNLGAFEWRYFSAQLEAVEHKIYPPSYQLTFNSKNQEDPQDRLLQYIAEKKTIDLSAAQALLVDFRLSIEQKLQNKESIALENWGILKSKKSGETELELKEDGDFLDPSRGLTVLDCHPILRDKSYLNQTVAAAAKKRKLFPWIAGGAAALVLIAAGVSSIWWWPALNKGNSAPGISEISIIPAITEQQEQLLELISAYDNLESEPIASLEEELNNEENSFEETEDIYAEEDTEPVVEPEVTVDNTETEEENTTVDPQPATSETSNIGPNDYIIVIGVFGEPSNYERNARLLREAGYEVQLKKLYTGYTRVAAVVNCSSEQELQEKWAAIRQDFTPKAWIAKN
jgi:hypothetical protein